MPLTLIRIISGTFMLFFHGLPKLMRYSDLSQRFADPIGLGSEISLFLVIFAEFFCSILLITGTFVRLASIPLIITMFVASFIVHADDPIQKIELPLLYLTIYMSLFLGGAGAYAFRLKSFRSKIPFVQWLLDTK